MYEKQLQKGFGYRIVLLLNRRSNNYIYAALIDRNGSIRRTTSTFPPSAFSTSSGDLYAPGISSIGVSDINTSIVCSNEEMTLLDPQHHFWQQYEEDIDTKNKAAEKLHTTIHSLREDGLFTMTYPHGEEAEIVYVEVERPSIVQNTTTLQTSCNNCNRDITAHPNLLLDNGSYYLRFSLDCDECDFSRTLERGLHRV